MKCHSNHHGVPDCDEPVFIPPGETTSNVCFLHFMLRIYISGKIVGRFNRPDTEAYKHLPQSMINWFEEHQIN